MQHIWTCKCCGRTYSRLPLSYGFSAPDYLYFVPEAERPSRTILDRYICAIDDQDFFLRGCLEIPIIGREEKFVWTLWMSLSKQSLKRFVDLTALPVPADEPPRLGRIGNALPGYPVTLEMRGRLHFRGDGLVPLVRLDDADHPLARDQRDGISLDRLQELAPLIMPGH